MYICGSPALPNRPLECAVNPYASIVVTRRGYFFSRSQSTSGKSRRLRARWRIRVLYLSRPSAASPSDATEFPAREQIARVRESWSHRKRLTQSSRRGTKPEADETVRSGQRRSASELDPCRPAVVTRYAVEHSDHACNSHGYDRLERDSNRSVTQLADACCRCLADRAS